jgi:hypothetical protein
MAGLAPLASPAGQWYKRVNAALELRLRPLRARLRLRRALDLASRALLVALVFDSLLLLAGQTAGVDVVAFLVAAPAAALGAAMVFALRSMPGTWSAAAAADHLGLQEQATSALYGIAARHPAAGCIESRALARLDQVNHRSLPMFPERRRLGLLLVASAGLAAAAILPLPGSEESAARAAERAAIAEAREAVKELSEEVEATAPDPVRDAIAGELEDLDEALGRSDDAEAAAQAIEQAQERIASFAGNDQYAARRTLDALATSWAGDPLLGELASTLHERDSEGIAEALEGLEAGLPGLNEAQQAQLELALQTGANLARDLPALAAALREAAVSVGESGEQGAGATQGFGSALQAVSQSALALAAAQGALGGLSETRSALAAAASGSSRGQQGSANAGDGSGSGDGSATSRGSNQRTGQGSGTGSSSGSDDASGSGGGGAGAGGGPAPGTQGSQNATGSGGGQGAPNQTAVLPYASVFDPSLLGGNPGVSASISGGAAGAQGETVDLSESPLTLGALRPYNEVYGSYEAAARQALTRDPLPPALEELVQDYFSAIAPGD